MRRIVRSVASVTVHLCVCVCVCPCLKSKTTSATAWNLVNICGSCPASVDPEVESSRSCGYQMHCRCGYEGRYGCSLGFGLTFLRFVRRPHHYWFQKKQNNHHFCSCLCFKYFMSQKCNTFLLPNMWRQSEFTYIRVMARCVAFFWDMVYKCDVTPGDILSPVWHGQSYTLHSVREMRCATRHVTPANLTQESPGVTSH